MSTSIVKRSRRAHSFVSLTVAAIVLVAASVVHGQPGSVQSAQSGAPVDLTGYWVSLVTEDWLWRMMTPAKGDVASLPVNAEGRRVAEAWDPARDEAGGEACRSYGAAAIMRVPGRIHISWKDANTLQVETDSGQQTRLFRFGAGATADSEPSWQGVSIAEWNLAGPAGRTRAPKIRGGSLKVVTSNLRPGYLRKNGVPYSGDTVVTEYFTRLPESFGDTLLVVTTIVEDPRYLTEPFITSTHFKKLPDNRGWNSTPCSAR